MKPPGSVADRVAGVDGCRGGWVVVEVDAFADCRSEKSAVWVAVAFAEVAERLLDGRLTAVALDLPIGLTDGGPRYCDQAARRALGARRGSVFSAPPRATLDCLGDWPAALAAARQANDGVGISKQTFNLLPKIAEVDAVVRSVGGALAPCRLIEAHPEMALAHLAGQLLASKHTAVGIAQRVRALARAALPHDRAAVGDQVPPGVRVGLDDILDAAGLADAARRWLRGDVTIVGGQTDRYGLPMRVLL